MRFPRRSGVLLHPTSLPSPYGVGDLGPTAHRFVDFLAASGQRLWQVLPLGPVGYQDSPYLSLSTFARNPLLVSPERLLEQGLLGREEVIPGRDPGLSSATADYGAAAASKRRMLELAHARFAKGEGALRSRDYEAFCAREASWLDDYALFATLKEHHALRAWTAWEEPLARRDAGALSRFANDHREAIERQRFAQFLFDEQWSALREACHARGIELMGDLALYVAHDSCDVWQNRELFYVDAAGRPSVIGGVPPDYFSATGQRWGNPLYRWDLMAAQGFSWWLARMQNLLRDVDIVRLDHFRGFEAYWEIPADEPTAVRGRWVDGPREAFFDALRAKLGALPLVAEDLGLITPPVRALMQKYELPGLAVLQFAFDGGVDDRFLPHTYEPHLVAYTGTHDNDTVVGWWRGDASTQASEAAAASRKFAREYLGIENDDAPHIAMTFCRTLLASRADTAIVPVQDLLGLGREARMNTPAVEARNWQWRVRPGQLSDAVGERLERWTRMYGRHVERTQPYSDRLSSPHT